MKKSIHSDRLRPCQGALATSYIHPLPPGHSTTSMCAHLLTLKIFRGQIL